MHGTIARRYLSNSAVRLAELAASAKVQHAQSLAANDEAMQGLRRSLQHAVRCGELLIEAKDLLDHGQWLPWLKSIGIRGRTASRYMDAARNKEAVIAKAKSAKLADFTDKVMVRLLKPEASQEYWTPPRYAEAVRKVLGRLDLDPASTAAANEVVQAARYFTKEQDGLSQPWTGNVYLNPPYGGLVPPFTRKLVEEYKAGRVKAAICLLNADHTDSPWWRPLWDGTLLCFCHERIWFAKGQGRAPFNSVFIHWGDDTYRQRFKRVFEELGTVAMKA